MKKFLISTLVFTVLSYIVQWVMDFVAPLGTLDGAQPIQPSLSSLTAMLNDPSSIDPAMLDSLAGGSMFDAASLHRMIVVTIITTLLLLAWSWRKYLRKGASLSTRGIRWTNNKNFLSIQAGAPAVTTTADNILLRGKPTYRILYFIYKGENTTRKPLRDVDGYIQSLRTNIRIPLLLDGLVHPGIYDIPAHSEFLVTARFGPSDGPLAGYEINEFWREFGAFKLVFEFNEKKYEEVFEKDRLEKLIDGRVKELRRS